MKSYGGLRPSFSAHVRWGERGAPVWSCGFRHRLEGKGCGIPRLVAGIEPKSVLSWRDPRFLSPVLTHALKPSIHRTERFRGFENPLPRTEVRGYTNGWARIKL